MNIKRIVNYLIVILPLTMMVVSSVKAHVLITDESGKVGGILHITPDDDPVAGQPSSIFFDIHDSNINANNYFFSLYVVNSSGHKDFLPTLVKENSISSTYIFQSQDIYKITLLARTINPKAAVPLLTFNYTQRVSRGTGGNANVISTTPLWADMALNLSVILFMILLIIGNNRRRIIAKYSRM